GDHPDHADQGDEESSQSGDSCSRHGLLPLRRVAKLSCRGRRIRKIPRKTRTATSAAAAVLLGYPSKPRRKIEVPAGLQSCPAPIMGLHHLKGRLHVKKAMKATTTSHSRFACDLRMRVTGPVALLRALVHPTPAHALLFRPLRTLSWPVHTSLTHHPAPSRQN